MHIYINVCMCECWENGKASYISFTIKFNTVVTLLYSDVQVILASNEDMIQSHAYFTKYCSIAVLEYQPRKQNEWIVKEDVAFYRKLLWSKSVWKISNLCCFSYQIIMELSSVINYWCGTPCVVPEKLERTRDYCFISLWWFQATYMDVKCVW